MAEHSSTSRSIERVYQERVAAMSPAERFARSAAMFQWSREQIARQIRAEQPHVSEEQLKWLVALRLYGNEPIPRKLIEQQLAHVSR